MKSYHLFTIVLLLLGPRLLAETYEPADYDPDAYHFFVGIDLEIPHESGFYPLLRLENNNAIIKVNGETIKEPLGKLENFQVKKGTKFSTNFVEVEELECEPGYSVDADPTLRAMRTNAMLNDISDQAIAKFDASVRQVDAAIGGLAAANADTSMDRGAKIANAQANLSTAQANFASANNTMNSVPSYVTKGQLGNTAYDVVNVSMRVKAARPMEDPILVMVIRLKDRPNGEVTASWMHFRALGPISTTESTINFTEPSYPDGKYVDSTEVFFFSNGNEIATNLSPKRVDLSPEQVRTFATFQYTTQNLGKTLPPKPGWFVLDSRIFRNTDPKLLDATLHLTVDENGFVKQVKTNATSDEYALDAMKEIMQDLMFYPALDKGNPVAGTLDIRLNDYAL